MRFVVLSDTHRYIKNAVNVLENFKNDVDGFIHLGDLCDDAAQLHLAFPDMRYYSVSGNNDYGEKEPYEKTAFIGGKKILLTHGHKQRAGFGLMYLDYFAREREADCVLFGHTHVPCAEFSGRTGFFNPGSISLPRSSYEPTFGILRVENGDIFFDIYKYIEADKFKKIKV